MTINRSPSQGMVTLNQDHFLGDDYNSGPFLRDGYKPGPFPGLVCHKMDLLFTAVYSKRTPSNFFILLVHLKITFFAGLGALYRSRALSEAASWIAERSIFFLTQSLPMANTEESGSLPIGAIGTLQRP